MTVEGLLVKLKAHLASLGDGRDCRSDNERATWFATRDTTQRAINALTNPGIERQIALLARWEAERTATAEKRAELEATIAAFTDHDKAGDMRARQAEFDRQQDVRRQLSRLLSGRLYRAPGECYLSQWYVDDRIADATARRDEARKTFDTWVTTAEQLLGETVTT